MTRRRRCRVAPGEERGEPLLAEADRRGVALPLVLLLLVALTGLAWGLSCLATAERRVARSAAVEEGARLLALGSLPGELSRLAGDSLPALPLWARRSLALRFPGNGPAVVDLTLERVAREWYLLGVAARLWETAPPWRAVVPVWALDPAARIALAGGVVAHGDGLTVEPGSTVDGDGLWSWAAGEGASGTCAALEASSDSLLPAGRLPASADRHDPDGPRLGLLTLGDLLDRLPSAPSGSWAPAPVVEGGRCRTEVSSNWGSPGDPLGPCGGFRPARSVRGDLDLAGGEGQGVLVVEGSLRMSGRVLFHGVVLVRDSLVLEGGARVEGLVRAGGAVRLREDARVEGRGCAAGLALAAMPGLRGARPAPGVSLLRVR